MAVSRKNQVGTWLAPSVIGTGPVPVLQFRQSVNEQKDTPSIVGTCPVPILHFRQSDKKQKGTPSAVGTGPRAICPNSFIIGIALQFHRPSEKQSPTAPSQKFINESHRAQRASPFRNPCSLSNPLCRLTHVVRLQKRFALCLAPRRMRAAFFAYFSSDAYSRLLC